MQITVYSKDDKETYILSVRHNQYGSMIWLMNESGEGMECDPEMISNVLYDALDDFFRKNH